jgi:epoxyqueuosine reductase
MRSKIGSATVLVFDAVGGRETDRRSEARENLAASIADGQHGDMRWPNERSGGVIHEIFDRTRGPASRLPCLMPGARIRCAHWCGRVVGRYRHARACGAGSNISLPSSPPVATPQSRGFVGTSPIMQKPPGETAGLGRIGKHTNLVSCKYGSWLLLGEIDSIIEIMSDPSHKGRPGKCVGCLAACPTDAFSAPYRLDAARRVSDLIVEHNGPVPHELPRLMSNRIYGRNDCLAVCPLNRFLDATTHAALRPRDDLTAPPLEQPAALDNTGFRVVFAPLLPVKRLGCERFVRDVLSPMGNSGDPELQPVAATLSAEPNPWVAEVAGWAEGRPNGLPGART